MNIENTIEILEALASGCSPHTGEVIENESALNERDVIRALQIAIQELKLKTTNSVTPSSIKESEIKTAIELFQHLEYSPTYSRLTHFFLKSKFFDYPELNNNDLYGKYQNQFSNKELHKFFKQFLINNGYTLHGKFKKDSTENSWNHIDFFEKPIFNNLTEKAIEQLKSKINEIGVLKTENLTESVKNSRVNFPRAYESWSNNENELLKKALKYTNDTNLLSECFQRGNGSINSYGKKLIYEEQKKTNAGNEN